MYTPFFKQHGVWLLPLLCISFSAQAVHLDVEIWGEGNSMSAGFCRTASSVGCDLAGLVASLQLPPNTLPEDGATGKMIFLTDFRDFSGGPYKTPNPGFQAVQNALNPGELVRYRALGSLQFWDAATRQWGPAPTGARIKLAGGIDPALVITDHTKCGGKLFCFAPGAGGGDAATLYTVNGIAGKQEMLVDAANDQGTLHTHLNWFLENNQGVLGGPIGAYMVEMQVLSNQRSQPSESFYILFNAGLPVADFSDALMDRVFELPDTPPPPPMLLPVANAGADRVVRIASQVHLDGSLSYDPQPGPDSLSYNWIQTVGTAVTLVGAHQSNPSFIPTRPGNYTFKLTVSNGTNAGYDEVTYTVASAGDVDLDGDIDRIDVALILRAAKKVKKKEPKANPNDVRDLDGNGIINRTDARMAKARCTLRKCHPTRR
ncbi:MAG: hypothetical protein Q7U98_05780 [Methylicorpusculum sp.]|uniref:PKD domain-containing protein n=1 Tax=Methylicorpusculum sp. TaxID=2713644 RepID=UPI002716651E|nr:dockerin type I domain-containing protein [Methylicorpusculum sp.]MDO8843283.1 hypothetical protein [Methylicorpusculum sp.]MDO8938649.1 hypothetical protein [Methylicorpusculum sp.]MDO9240026.1 hypothetical protein [Methylicorpusculum sp.]MDP2204327.1 hypothetical protein [Methylicorpusculum sp.]